MPNVHPWHIKRGLRKARKSSADRALLDSASDDVRAVVGEGFKNLPPPSTPENRHVRDEAKRAALALARRDRNNES